MYVAEYYNHRIRKVTAAGVVTTLAGSGSRGFSDGAGSAAMFRGPVDVAVDASGNVYVADYENHKIRKITAAGMVTTLAGSVAGFADGTGTAAKFYSPSGVAVDASGNVYVADQGSHKIRKITPLGVVTTLAGSTAGFTDGTGTAAKFNEPSGVAIDASGNVYVADSYNNRIRKITSTGVVTTLAGGSASNGTADGTGSAARFGYPNGVAIDANGIMYVSDYMNDRIRKISIYGYSISPALPAGLSFDGTTGTISGTPTVASPASTYTITAYNASGSSSTNLTLAVGNSQTGTPQTITFPALEPVTFGAPDIVPGATSTNATIPITYTSNNSAIGTISAEGKIQIVRAGIITITASQAGNAIFSAATPVMQTLKVLPAIVNASSCGSGPVTLTASGGSAGDYRWYTTQTGGTAIAGAINATYTTPILTNATTTYYVSVVTGSTESERKAVTATINPIPATPMVVNDISYCLGAIPTALMATGMNLNWYTLATGGTGSTTAPVPSTSTAGTTDYYVSQSVNGCESPRAKITVAITALPVVTFSPFVNPICSSVTNLTLNGALPAGGTYSGPGVSNGVFDASTAGEGSHTITYTITANECTVSTTQNITVSTCTGIKESELATDLNLYPNPAQEKVLLILPLPKRTTLGLNLINAKGEVIMQKNYGQVQGEFKQVIDVKNLAKGFYLLQLIAEDGIIMKRLVLQ